MTNYVPPRTPQGVPTGGSFEPFLQTPQPEGQMTSQPSNSTQVYPPAGGRFAEVMTQQTPFPSAPQAVNQRMSYQQAPVPPMPQVMNPPMSYQQTPVPPMPQAVNQRMPYQQAPVPPMPQAMQPNMSYQQPPFQGNNPMFGAGPMRPDQQWYRTNAQMGQGTAVMQPPSYPQHQPTFQPSWNQPGYYNTSGPANAGAVAPRPMAAPEQSQDKAESSRDFILQYVQPGLAGLMDGSVSTLAPIFSVAFATHQSFTTFLVGMASALGAGISMTFAEALSDDGEQTGRGKPFLRGGVTGLMTFLSGAGHALPFLIADLHIALIAAYAVVAVELLVIAAIRHKFFGTSWGLSIVQVVGGGALVFVTALLLGSA